MTGHVHILLGGLQSIDGYVTSRGMLGLEDRIKVEFPKVTVAHYLWADYLVCYSAMAAQAREDQNILIGYSGGGTHAQWLAEGYDYRSQRIHLQKIRIDLLIGYDPSPAWGFVGSTIRGPLSDNVKRAICYWNQMPLMFGLGGGKYDGPQVEIVPIRMQHLGVQYMTSLHDRTMREIFKCLALPLVS